MRVVHSDLREIGVGRTSEGVWEDERKTCNPAKNHPEWGSTMGKMMGGNKKGF